MSSPRPARLNPRIKISKNGRPYIEVADLVRSQLDRESSRESDFAASPQRPDTSAQAPDSKKDKSGSGSAPQ